MADNIPAIAAQSLAIKQRLFKYLKSACVYIVLILLITHAVDFYRLFERDSRQIPSDLLPQLIEQLPTAQRQAFYQGQPMLVYIWATWCGVCKTTSRAVSNISADYPVASIAMQSGDKGQLNSYLQQNNYAFSTLADPDGEWARRLQTQATPSFFIVSISGYIKYYSVGINTEPSLRAKLALYN